MNRKNENFLRKVAFLAKQKMELISLILFSLICFDSLNAQSTINSAGSDAAGSGGTVAYSVGQLVYTCNTGISGTIVQGVQHAFEIVTVGIEDTNHNISLDVYPNPTSDTLMIKVNLYNNEKLSYRLLDNHGKQLVYGQVSEENTQIDVKSLPPATYYLNIVNQENKKVQLFKIIKN